MNLDREEMAAKCNSLVAASGLTRTEVAKRVKTSRPTLCRALDHPDSRDDQLRIRIMQHFGFSVTGPVWVVK